MDSQETQRWVCSSQTQLLELPRELQPPQPIQTPIRRKPEVVPTSRSCERELRWPPATSVLGGSSDSEASSPTLRRARTQGEQSVPSIPHASSHASPARTKHRGEREVIPTSQSETEGEITPESIAVIAARCAALGFNRQHPTAGAISQHTATSDPEICDDPYDAHDEYSDEDSEHQLWSPCPSPPRIASQSFSSSMYSSSPASSSESVPSVVREFHAMFEREDETIYDGMIPQQS
ncbi:hypothetical protein OH76DRAFT_1479971 [Lentinus brumalis]|uniref:Uncharacterized protein n=1 Tax=Lentinus brumalis TaxID=2498619 RepID=A0A371DM01_9APHY|nr:hypothetical protein OH76DRAFT_1479971 [Polyporus brumalis]